MSIRETHPEYERYYSRNNAQDFSAYSRGSNKPVIWTCPVHDHEFTMSLYSRLRKPVDYCIYCDGNKLLSGFNDLETAHPELIPEWSATNEKSPSEYSPRSSYVAEWVCPQGHRYTAHIYNRSRGSSCALCAGNAFNTEQSVAHTHPEWVSEWNHVNRTSPDTTLMTSQKGVHWICNSGHRWFQSPESRNKHPGCPVCSGKRKNLPTSMESLLDTDLNSEESLSFLTVSSERDFHWKCPQGHTWKRSPREMSALSTGCPYCNSTWVLAGFNDIRTTHPHVSHFWNDNRNIEDFKSNSSYRAQWSCDRGHVFHYEIVDMVSNPRCPFCHGIRAIPGESDFLSKKPELESEWDYGKNISPPGDFLPGSNYMAFWLCSEGHSWRARIRSRVLRGDGCKKCVSSQGEKEVREFLENIIDTELLSNNRSFLNGKEIDIYIPEKKIAIEYNGVYWHSEEMKKDRNYHFDKWRLCREKGVDLITVWEDDWVNRRKIVEKMLRHKLGISSQEKVGARKTSVSTLSFSEAASFLDNNHIQGATTGSVYLGLIHDGNIVAVSVWKKNREILYLERYATSMIVVGGMGKLLKSGVQYGRERGCSQVITFADHCVSDGGLYDKLGFRLDKELNPDYRYVVGNKRVHKFNYRLKRFRDDPELIYVEGMSERELARLNNIPRIWDCGKSRYVYDVT